MSAKKFTSVMNFGVLEGLAFPFLSVIFCGIK